MRILNSFVTAQTHNDENYYNPFKNSHRASHANLSEYRRNGYAQTGEDGIIEYVFSIVNPRNKYLVDFGASDGDWISNSKYLRHHQNWTGLLMDGDYESTLRSNGSVKHEFVNSKNIMNLFEKYSVPKDFEFLSIDVDGDDIYIFDAIDTDVYRPALVIAEYNPSLPNHLPLAIEEGKSDYALNPHDKNIPNFPHYHGCNIHAWWKVAERKNYKMLTTCGVNVILIANEHADKFSNYPTLEEVCCQPYFNFEVNRYEYALSLDERYKWIHVE